MQNFAPTEEDHAAMLALGEKLTEVVRPYRAQVQISALFTVLHKTATALRGGNGNEAAKLLEGEFGKIAGEPRFIHFDENFKVKGMSW